MKRLIILSTLTLLFLGAWVYGQCGQDLVLWTQATAADDPNEMGDPNEIPGNRAGALHWIRARIDRRAQGPSSSRCAGLLIGFIHLDPYLFPAEPEK